MGSLLSLLPWARKMGKRMAESEIRIPFDERKLDALKVALYYAGKDFGREMESLIEQYYLRHVPEQERAVVQAAIERTAEEEQAERFVVVRLTCDDEVLCMTASGSNSLYRAASQCREMLDDVQRYSLDTVAQYFTDVNFIDDTVYDVLARAAVDPSIKTVMEFDFDDCILSVRDRNGTACYEMDDLSKAYDRANLVPGLSVGKREEIFYEELRGKEIEIAAEPHLS